MCYQTVANWDRLGHRARHRDNKAHLIILTRGSVNGSAVRCHVPFFMPQLAEKARSRIESTEAVLFRPAPTRKGKKKEKRKRKLKKSLAFKEIEVFTYGNLLPRSVFRREVQFEQWEWV